MEARELLDILERGEDGSHQFKVRVNHAASLASEMAAFANCDGGMIVVGVRNDGTISGLSRDEVDELNQLISNAGSQIVRPSLHPRTENVMTDQGLVVVITIPRGDNRPYVDHQGAFWVKSGSDKRKVSSREEIRRMFQQGGLLHGDELPVPSQGVNTLDRPSFERYFRSRYEEAVDEQDKGLADLLTSMNLMREGYLNVTGVLLFGKLPQHALPAFVVKAIAFPGTSIDEDRYEESRDIEGRMPDVFEDGMAFFNRHLPLVQGNGGVNSTGSWSIPRSVFEETFVNALLHRDYLLSAPIRIFSFSDRFEIVSPGHLPNNLTIENILRGNSNMRNPVLASHGAHLLPYRGLGTGVGRACRAWPWIRFEDDRSGNLFRVIIFREEPSPSRGIDVGGGED